MKGQSTSEWDGEVTLVSQLAAAASLFAFLFYFRRGDLLLYGDAVAHINIARRVIDSQTPGLLQLGTVWLPLPHLFMVPFLFSDAAWRTGIAGSIPSMCAYVFSTAGIFLLVRSSLNAQKSSEPVSPSTRPTIPARTGAWMAAIVYAANPNLLYMQTTAMTEPLYLAFFIWSVVHFSDFVRASGPIESRQLAPARSLIKCGWCVLGATLIRYDGWMLAGVLCVATACVTITSKRKALRFTFGKFLLLASIGPLLWLAYNAIIYRNPLEFANGQYSARAIEQHKTALSASSPHPGWHSLPVSFSYFFKSAEDNIAPEKLQIPWVVVLLAGLIVILACNRRLWPLLLLALPIAFYTLSVAYGSIPIYLPDWWPFSHYNVRFGLEMVPAFVVALALAMHFLIQRIGKPTAKMVVSVCTLAFVFATYGLIWKSQPICYREAWVNSRSRIALDQALASTFLKLPRDSTLLMYLGDHVGALQDAGIPLRRTINEGNHRPWKAPADPEGLWERALADPQKYADYAVSIDDDPVAKHIQRRDLTSMVVIRTVGEPPATIYWTHRVPGNQTR
jgi:hypothetical protein